MSEALQTETAQFEADAYDDSCAVCGVRQLFVRDRLAIRESYRCNACKALLREREQASVLVSLFGRGRYGSVAELCSDSAFKNLAIYEPGTAGPLRRYLRALPGYRQSAFYADRERASATADIPHETLEALTFEDESFDLVLSSDILEHVRRPLVAFQEIRRVLRPGGVNLFTVPLQEPLRAKTVWRVDTSGDTDEFPLPRHFHGDGRGGRSLVYVDFGRDLLGMLEQVGYAARFVRPETASPTANQIVTVMAVRA